jgi:uncharacterized repeat protein (TIGR01451 family)/fimbrial isopeptide formation D2 family protein
LFRRELLLAKRYLIMRKFPRTLFGLISTLAILFCLTVPARADYIKRFTTIDTGAMTFTGNTLGLNKATGQNNPGTAGSIGAFIDTNTSSQVGTYPAGTTLTWSQNASAANLNIPAGSTILYAELIWGGSYMSVSSNPQDVSAYLNNSITMTTPSGFSYSISPDGATAKTCGDSTHYFYVRSADVTAYVQSTGAGTYTVGGVPATVDPLDNSNNCAGWTLAVVYRNTSLPIRSMSVFVGCEFTSPTGGSTASAVAGFCVNNTGTINGRIMVSAMEGDIQLTGDQMMFGPTGAMQAISGPNNPVNNFFESMINSDTGALDGSGTFGGTNPPTSAGRQGWDITNVDVSGILQHGQTSASAQGTSTGDGYATSSIGIQVDVGAPTFPTSVMTVDKSTTYVGDTLTYTTRLDNTTGTADAQSVIYKSLPPPYTSFISGSVKTSTDGVNYTSVPGADPTVGFNIGNVVVGAQIWIQYIVTVNAVPLSPAAASYVTNSSWTYNFLSSCPGVPILQATTSSNYTTATLIDRLDVSKSASVSGGGTTRTITWTITITNSGLTNTSGSTLTDPIVANTTYTAGSTTMNGTAVADGTGHTMPFAAGGLIKSAGAAAGVVNAGATVTVVFKATVNRNNLPVTNTATIDPDGSGQDPAVQAIASTTAVNANLGVTVTDGATTKVPGTSDTYTVIVTNNGPATVTSLTLSVSLPAAVLSPSYAASTGTYDPSTGSWSGLNLASGQQITLTITGLIDPAATGSLALTATVAVPPGVTDTNSANNTATDTDTLTPQADLSVTKTDGQTTALPGSQATYTITVTNNGPSSITSCWVRDTIPANLQNPVYTPNMGTYNVTSQYWTDVNLASGQSAVITVQGTVLAGSPTLVNSVTVSPPYNTTDPNSANNTATDTDTVPVISIAKTVNPTTALMVAPVTYTITLTSVSNSATTVTSIVDTLPAGFSYKAGSTTGLTTVNPSIIGQTLTWSGSWTVPANGTATLNFQAITPNTRGTFTNSATASGPGFAAVSTGNTASLQIVSPVMSFSKTADKTDAAPGSTITYTLTYSNIGDAPAYTVIILDNVPVYTTYVTSSTVGTGTTIQWSHDGGTTWNSSDAAPVTGIKWTVSPLAPNGGGTLSFKVTVN